MSFWKENKSWLVPLILVIAGAIIIYLVWYYVFAPPWKGIGCGEWSKEKWKVLRANQIKLAEKGAFDAEVDAEDLTDPMQKEAVVKINEMKTQDPVKRISKAFDRPHYSKDPWDRSFICSRSAMHDWRNNWEEYRAQNGLDFAGKPTKKEWRYNGPISCLKGLTWPEYYFIKMAWMEYWANNSSSGDPNEGAGGARWIWDTAGMKEWAQSFGSDTHTIDQICNELNGKGPSGQSPNYRPDLIKKAKSLVDKRGADKVLELARKRKVPNWNSSGHDFKVVYSGPSYHDGTL